MTKRIRGVVLVTALLVLSGCTTARPVELQNPAPSSSYTKARAWGDALRWSVAAPGRTYGYMSPTGSMAPLLDSRSIALYEPYTGQPLYPGDAIVFDRGDSSNVLHRIDEVQGDYLRISGINNRRSDGWFHKSKVKLRLVGVLYTSR